MSFLHDFPLILHETIHMTIHGVLVFMMQGFIQKFPYFLIRQKKKIEVKKVDKILQMGHEVHIL